jgi:hypothetical protein
MLARLYLKNERASWYKVWGSIPVQKKKKKKKQIASK